MKKKNNKKELKIKKRVFLSLLAGIIILLSQNIIAIEETQNIQGPSTENQQIENADLKTKKSFFDKFKKQTNEEKLNKKAQKEEQKLLKQQQKKQKDQEKEQKKLEKEKKKLRVQEIKLPQVQEGKPKTPFHLMSVMTIDDCVDYALSHNPNLSVSKERIKAAKSTINQARASYAPR